jgi:hypothetical protein
MIMARAITRERANMAANHHPIPRHMGDTDDWSSWATTIFLAVLSP